MIRVFLDASVIFSAIYSRSGASREILRLALGGFTQIAVSRYVIEEAERTLAEKAPDKVELLRTFLELLEPEIIPEPTKREVLQAATYINDIGDAPVVAAAINARPDYLATLDRKHLIEPPQVAEKSGLRIVLPQVVLKAIREDQAGMG